MSGIVRDVWDREHKMIVIVDVGYFVSIVIVDYSLQMGYLLYQKTNWELIGKII